MSEMSDYVAGVLGVIGLRAARHLAEHLARTKKEATL
jgi:hypothetical protein